jgi:hypothetical protein
MAIRSLVAPACVIAALAFGATRVGIGAAEGTEQSSTAQPETNMKDMMAMHEQMMAAMKAGDAKLDALLSEMNAATGDAKVRALAALVTELVQQHKGIHGRMGQMHQHMMGGRGMMMHQ